MGRGPKGARRRGALAVALILVALVSTLGAAAASSQGPTVNITASPASWTGWATYGIEYFTLKCTWDDGRADPGCTRAGSPHWSTDYGWFEAIPKGLAKTRMNVAPLSQRHTATTGQTILWSSGFNSDNDQSGHITVSYGGTSLSIPVTAYRAASTTSHPLPPGYLQDQPSNPNVNNMADVGKISGWAATHNISDPNYQAQKLALAQGISQRLESYIKLWLAGKASAVIPDSVFSGAPYMSSDQLRWKLVRPRDFDPYSFWGSRPAVFHYDPARDGVTTLFPDINTTYIRADYPAPFSSKIVVKGEFPHSRFFDLQDSGPFDPRYPAGPSVGSPEVPIVDADINPDSCSINPFRVYNPNAGAARGCGPAAARTTPSHRVRRAARRRQRHRLARRGQGQGQGNAPVGSSCTGWRDGMREAPAQCRHYTVTFLHAAGDYVSLNDAVNPGFASETSSHPLRAPGGTNVRVASGIRDGGGITLGELLPAQLWIRYYQPDYAAGVYGGVPLPTVYFQLDTGEKYAIEPLRGPDPQGVGHDNFIRRLNGPYPEDQFKDHREYEPQTTAWGSDVGWKKTFGIARSIYEDVAIGGLGPYPFAPPASAPLTREYIRWIDTHAYGRGPNVGSIGAFEQSATTCDYCHYMGRHLVIGPGHVAVLTAKLPITPKTRDGEPYMTGGELRYFSISRYINGPNQDDILNLVLPAGDFGSLNDEDLITQQSGPAKGWYTLVFSRAEDRPANATAANGVTWSDWTDRTEQTMVLRWLEVGHEWSSSWAPNMAHLPWTGNGWSEPGFDPNQTFRNQRAGSFMGDHQIVISYMTKQQFEALGNSIDPRNIPHTNDWPGALSPYLGLGPVNPPGHP